MAAFTHIGVESRFSDGSFGVYYVGSRGVRQLLRRSFIGKVSCLYQ